MKLPYVLALVYKTIIVDTVNLGESGSSSKPDKNWWYE